MSLRGLPLFLLAACASTAGQAERHVVLGSDRFTWSAASGLGWGSRIAPVLARLERIPGVAAGRVDWTGTRFLLTLADGADPRDVAERAVATLDGASVLEGDAAREAVAAYRNGEKWLRPGETVQLSQFEAGVLAELHGSRAAARAQLDEDRSRKLVALLAVELRRAFERAHAGQGVDDLPAECAAASKRVLDASAAFLTGEQQAQVAAYLQRFERRRRD